MRILEVIHGYPPLYNAGSEVYTQTVARALRAAGHHVSVFCREEDPYRPSFALRKSLDDGDCSIPIYLVNHAQSRNRFRHEGLEEAFACVVETEHPDVVHFGHLNHLSLGLPEIAKRVGCRVALTLHDYWLACPRGQFLQMRLGEAEAWQDCEGQEDNRCARHCFSRDWTGVTKDEIDLGYWSKWTHLRMEEVHRQLRFIDVLLSPSQHLRTRVAKELRLEPGEILFEPYGFDRARLAGRVRTREEDLVFGFMGRITPAKGIHQLLEAIGGTRGPARLRVWGTLGEPDRAALLRQVAELPGDRPERVSWMGGYRNEELVHEVLNHLDVLVVPSIWDENSPLVIHEAQQARVPVITSDRGGMGELVRHGVNGWTFRHRDASALAARLQQAIDSPDQLLRLGARGYLGSRDGQVPSIGEHVGRLEALFAGGRVRDGDPGSPPAILAGA